jgi:type VI secretion system secreted protein VgrG
MAIVVLSFPGAASVPALSVRHFDIAEGLSMPFEAVILAASPDPDIDFDLLVGKPAACRIDRGALGARAWSGVCSSVQQIETEADGLSLYAIRIVPRLWLLSQRRNHRVFQHLSTIGIARALLAEWGIEATLRLDEASFPRHEYRVQYGESDLAFLSRLLEDAGVSYFFEAEGDETRLVLASAPERGEPTGAPLAYASQPSLATSVPYLTDARVGFEVRPGAVAIDDFDLRKPLFRLSYEAGPGEAKLTHRIYAPGIAIVDTDAPQPGATDTPVADDRSRARTDDREGHAIAGRLLEALRSGRCTLGFSTNLATLAPGSVFSIEGAPRPELGPDQRFCVISTSLEGLADGEWKIAVVAAFASARVTPALATPRPRIEGLQSAVVVGPDGEDIHVDELGRVRLRFPWDREANQSIERSPWVRVADGWAGAGWGMIAVPRVGQEVLVDFFEGGPDQRSSWAARTMRRRRTRSRCQGAPRRACGAAARRRGRAGTTRSRSTTAAATSWSTCNRSAIWRRWRGAIWSRRPPASTARSSEATSRPRSPARTA